jgi:hypothetical protein
MTIADIVVFGLVAPILAVAAFGLARLLGFKVAFGKVFTAVSIALVMLPVFVWSFILCVGIAFGLLMAVVAVLEATGLFPVVAAWPTWDLIPLWLWSALGGAAVYGAIFLYQEVKDRRRARRVDLAAGAAMKEGK